MDNDNNSLYEAQNEDNLNNRRDIFKFIISSIINLSIISCFISYTIKYSTYKNNLSNNKYKFINNNKNSGLRNLESDKVFSRVEKQIIYNTKNNVVDDEMKKYLNLLLQHLGSGFDTLRDFISGKPIIMSKEAYLSEKQKQIFLSRLMKNVYTGTWEYFPFMPEEGAEKKNLSKIYKLYYLNSSQNNFRIGDYRNGTVHFNFKKAMEMTTKQEAIALTMKNLEGNYIDNWIQHISYAKINELSRITDKKNNLFLIKGEFSSTMIKGKLFHNKRYSNKKYQCSTLTEIDFPLEYVTLQTTLNNKSVVIRNISSIDPSNFTMILSSTCGFRIKIKAHIHDRIKEYYETKQKVNYFSYYCLLSSFLYLIGICCLTYSLKNNESAVSAISLECYCQNIAWHSYCGISNINFGLIYSEYFGNFCIVALFPLLNFVIFDLRFLYYYWKIKKRVISDRQFIKLRLKFFAMFYSLLFLSFFSITSFYTNQIYIVILSIAIWTPQIIYNIIHNNKYIYPTFYLLATTIDRIIYPFYYRGIEFNYMHLKHYKILILFLSSYIILSIIFLYLQAFFGPRFMLSHKYQKKNNDFHKTRQELLEIKPNCIKEECVICLSPLFEAENNIINKNNENNNSNNNSNINMNLNISINNSEIESESSSDSPTELKSENKNNTSQNSRIDLMNSQINQQNVSIKNNLENNNKNIKNGLNLCKYNKMNTNNNNGALAINVKCNEKKNNNSSGSIFSKIKIKGIGKIMKIVFCESLFSFYKLKIDLGDKKFMLIHCGHVFHTSCLEKWFERKKECPSCRASMEEYL